MSAEPCVDPRLVQYRSTRGREIDLSNMVGTATLQTSPGQVYQLEFSANHASDSEGNQHSNCGKELPTLQLQNGLALTYFSPRMGVEISRHQRNLHGLHSTVSIRYVIPGVFYSTSACASDIRGEGGGGIGTCTSFVELIRYLIFCVQQE